MAQTNKTPILLYHSTVALAVPSNANLQAGELAMNIADMKLYAENSGGTVTLLASSDAAAGNFTTVDTTNLEVTNIKAKDGTAAIVLTDSTGAVTVNSAFSTTGNTTLGNASGDSVTINGTISSNLIFTDNTYDIGATGATRPRNLFLAGSATIESLTSGRLPLISTGGLITDSASITYVSTGSSAGLYVDITGAGNALLEIRNRGAGGAIFAIKAEEGSEDPRMSIAVANGVSLVVDWNIGIDNSVNNNLIISTSSTFSSAGNKFAITTTGSVITNATGSALLTTATDGFTYIPTCAGTPSGVPTSVTGAAPLIVDSTNSAQYFYSGSAWRKIVSADGSGNVSIGGNLTVTGATTILSNATSVDITSDTGRFAAAGLRFRANSGVGAGLTLMPNGANNVEVRWYNADDVTGTNLGAVRAYFSSATVFAFAPLSWGSGTLPTTISLGMDTSVSGALTVSGTTTLQGNTVLGDAAGDTLTINSGAWTQNQNVTLTRSAGAVANSTVNLFATTFSASSGGASSDIRGLRFSSQFDGTVAAQIFSGLLNSTADNHTSATQSVIRGIHSFYAHIGSGNTSNAYSIASQYSNTSSGVTTNYADFYAYAPSITDAAIRMTTHYGFTSGNLGIDGKITNVSVFSAPDQTGTSGGYVRGLDLSISSSGSGTRHNLFIGGTALNYFAGNVGSGITAPSAKFHASAADATYLFAGSGTTKGFRVVTDANQTVIQGVDTTLTGSFQPLSFGGSDLRFQTNGTTERMRIDSSGNVVVNTAAIATTATDGFLYVPSCAGTPTGVPTSYTGRVPIVVDSTNNKLYFYSGGSWRDAGP